MFRNALRTIARGPAIVLTFAILVIGCGGGGGGGTRSGNPISGGSSGSSNNLTGSTGSNVDPTTGGTTAMTTGEITTGSTGASTTTGDPSTTGGSTTSSGSTDGSATTSTTSGSSTTSSSTTTGSASTGSTTTGSSSTGSTTTTGTSTTGTSTTGGTTGGSLGALRANAIYFGRYYAPSQVFSILPDGTGLQTSGSGDDSVLAAVPDPVHSGELVYAKVVGSAYGIYRGTTFNTSASTQILAPSLDYVTGLQAAGDGSVLVVGWVDGVSYAFVVTDGIKTTIGEADSATISSDGEKVAFSKPLNGYSHLYAWDRATTTTIELAGTGDSLFPSFSRDGAWVLFSSNRGAPGDNPWDLYQVPSGGGTIQQVTNTPGISEMGGCYNESRTMVSYVGQRYVGGVLDESASGLYVTSNSGYAKILADSTLNLATYWTDSSGRSTRSNALRVRYQSLTPRQRH